MPDMNPHPSQDQLNAYNLGQLSPEETSAVENHINECEPCCETIISMSSDDTFVGLLKEARQSPTDQTLDHDSLNSKPFESTETIPIPLAEHPRYEVFGLIGKGGMGRVYQARHRMMDRSVALKVINREWILKPEVIDRFHREVKTAASLDHPNIVTSHDAEQAEDLHFLVMEFVDGVDLSDTVKQRGPLPIAEACDFIRQAAEGLQYAHDRGMVHRDIKPHNLMVTRDKVVKILDFGLASLTPQATPDEPISEDADGNLTIAGAIMGTPDFISPEQAQDARKVDGRSDIYSLGATLYFLLSGRVPFAEGSVMHKLKSHAQLEPDSLKTLRNELPDELVAIVSKMMAKDPDERYLAPRDVVDALESFLRTWQPDGANSQGKLLLGGGDTYESGGQSSGAVDAGRNWLLVIARVLFAISLVPVALLVYETWTFDRANPDVGVGYRTWAYMLVTLCLSTIAGIASAVHRLHPARSQSNRGDRRLFKMTASEFLTVAAILIVGCLALGLYYTNGSIGGIRVEVTTPEDIGSLGTHPLTIVDKSGQKPLGGTSSTHQDDASGITTHSFKSANGRYDITLVGNVLTVNGEKYTLENPTDAIRIVDDRVEITHVQEIPRRGDVVNRNAGQKRQDNQLKMPLCWCPAGEFKMHRKQVPVTLTRGFWMGKYEVTQAQYQGLMGDNPSENKGESLPVEKVAWNKAKNFCQKLTELERKAGRLPQGWEYRLPTEAQWEYACRAGTTLIWDDEKALVYPSTFGEDLRELGDYAWYSENSEGTPHPVGQKKPNAWGLCDMHGNVREWVRDAWQSKLAGGKDPEVDVGAPIHTYRGGDWLTDAEPCGSPFSRGFGVADREAHMKGFRVALVPVGDSGDGAAAGGDLKLLQGDWEVTAFTQNGRKEFAADKGVGMLVQIKGETITRIQTMPNGEKASKVWGRIELNNDTNPKSIDIVNPDAPGGRLLGIYELGDDDLQICFAERTNVDDAEGRPVTRPATFDAPAGSEMALLECRRAVEDPDLKQLQGDWEAVSVTEGGKQLSTEKAFGSLLLQIEGSKFAVTETKPNGSQSEPDTGLLEICSTINPKTIDFIDGDGSNKRSIGIYELNDRVLKICVAETGGHDSLPGESIPEVKRPKTFDSPAGSNMILMEFRRKQPDESANSSNERVDATPAAEKDEKQPARLSIQEKQHRRDQEIFNFMYEHDPELQKSTADSFIARGDYVGAKRVLSSVQPADSLVARYALANEGTKALGEQLADRALAEVERQSDPLRNEAIQQEWQTITGEQKRE